MWDHATECLRAATSPPAAWEGHERVGRVVVRIKGCRESDKHGSLLPVAPAESLEGCLE